MPSCTSYQLPDLLGECRELQLRTNKNCWAVTEASLKWFSGREAITSGPRLTDQEREYVHSSNFGLLAALCFPTCDAPQLRLVTDFWTLFTISNARALRDLQPEWSDDSFETAVDAFANHELFKCLQPRLDELISTASSLWRTRFDEALRSFCLAQHATIADLQNNREPDIDEYLELRRNISALRLFVSFIEAVEGLVLRQGSPEEEAALQKLRESTVSVIALSWDIFSYNVDQASGSRNNIVSILMAQKDLTLQGAMNAAAVLVKEALADFAEAERLILSLHPLTTEVESKPTWSWNPLALLSSSVAPAPSRSVWDEAAFNEVKLFIQGLKDCIIGALNWSYETGLFFGGKGEEVRTFGWVFLLPSPNDH